AFGDGVGRVGEDFHDAHRLHADHHLERTRIEKVADQHACRIAESRIGGLAAATQFGFVDHVVVQQCGGVDELDHGGQLVMVAAPIAASARRQQQYHRSQTLAARADDVFGNLGDEYDV